MQTPFGEREPEAYIPPEPFEPERYWPPAWRRARVESLRGWRLRQRELAVDRRLEAVADRIRAEKRELSAAGLSLLELWPDPERGVVKVLLFGGAGESAVASFFAARYGEAVGVVWLGPERLGEVPHRFGSWTSDGRRIRVFFALDHNGQEGGRARVAQETEERIVIALSCLEPVDFKTRMGGFRPHHADVELREPVGARAVIDATVGVVRPSLVELRSHRAQRRAARQHQER